MREHLVVPSIRSGEVARTERSGVRGCEDALQPLDFSNALFGVHPSQASSTKREAVKREPYFFGEKVSSAIFVTSVSYPLRFWVNGLYLAISRLDFVRSERLRGFRAHEFESGRQQCIS